LWKSVSFSMGFAANNEEDDGDADLRSPSKPNKRSSSALHHGWSLRPTPILLILWLVANFLQERVGAFRPAAHVKPAISLFHKARPLQRFGTILNASTRDSQYPCSHIETEEEDAQSRPLLVRNLDQIRVDIIASEKDSFFDDQRAPFTRRMMLGAACIGIGSALGGSGDVANAVASSTSSTNTVTIGGSGSRLQWQVTPVNKRTGVTVFDAERTGYKVNFVTYLSRFLLTFDRDCQFWWYQRATDIPLTATPDQVLAYRTAQFAAFSASVEVGLQEYSGPNGPETLLAALIRRYCRTTSAAPTESASGSSAVNTTQRLSKPLRPPR
jgi:hypothetical protein